MSIFYDFIDTLLAHVDAIDMSTKYVDVLTFYRHDPGPWHFLNFLPEPPVAGFVGFDLRLITDEPGVAGGFGDS